MPEAHSTRAWTKITLAECAEEIAERVDNPAESGFERFVGLEHMETGNAAIRSWGSTDDVTSSMKVFKEGDVIVARRNVYLRRAARAGFDGLCSGDGIVLRAKSAVCLPDLLSFLLNTASFWNYVTSQADGTMSKRITVKRLLSYEFALPPIEEQQRVLTILRAVQRLRESYGCAAVAMTRVLESQFAEVIRGNNRPLPPKPRSLLDVSTWNERSVGELCTLGGGHGFRPSDWSDKGMPIIRIQNVRGSREFNHFDGIPDPGWIVEPGELLFAWAGVPGVSFGPGIWPGPRALLNQHIYRVTPHEWVQRDWLYEVLLFLTPQIERRAHGFKTSLLHIRKEEFTSQRVLVPPADQQAVLSTWMTEQRQLQDALTSRSSASEGLYHSILDGVLAAA